jgi:hypothetical protein
MSDVNDRAAFIAHYATSGELRAAARAARISEATARRWLGDPETRSEVARLRTQVRDELTAKLLVGAASALDLLIEMVGDETRSDGLRLSAARTLLAGHFSSVQTLACEDAQVVRHAEPVRSSKGHTRSQLDATLEQRELDALEAAVAAPSVFDDPLRVALAQFVELSAVHHDGQTNRDSRS